MTITAPRNRRGRLRNRWRCRRGWHQNASVRLREEHSKWFTTVDFCARCGAVLFAGSERQRW